MSRPGTRGKVRGTPPRVAIIGAGAGGICTGVGLRRLGVGDFTIFDQASGPGGTWWDNVYPGAEVDTPQPFYSFSFAPYDFSRTHVKQPELLAYLQNVAGRYGLDPHFRFNTGVEKVIWDESAHTWEVLTTDGKSSCFEVVVSAVGMLNHPRFPDWPGLDGFEGIKFHSARWPSDVDLTGQRVAVVGTGSTSGQLVPAIAPDVAHLYLFQRQPGWLRPKMERDLDPGRARRHAQAAPTEEAAAPAVVELREGARDRDRGHLQQPQGARGLRGLHRDRPRRSSRPRQDGDARLPLRRQAGRPGFQLLPGAVAGKRGADPSRRDRGDGPRHHRRHRHRAGDRRPGDVHRVPARPLPGHLRRGGTGRAIDPRGLGRESSGLPGPDRRRLPEFLHAVGSQHQLRPGHVPARAAGRVCDRKRHAHDEAGRHCHRGQALGAGPVQLDRPETTLRRRRRPAPGGPQLRTVRLGAQRHPVERGDARLQRASPASPPGCRRRPVDYRQKPSRLGLRRDADACGTGPLPALRPIRRTATPSRSEG